MKIRIVSTGTSCQLCAECHEAYDVLQEVERWDQLGIVEYLHGFARKQWEATIDRVTVLLDLVFERKKKRGPKKGQGGRPKNAK